MSAYMIIEARITDRERFMAYARATPDVVSRYGGEYVVMGGSQEALEGDDDGSRLVVSRWPDRAAALAFWHSAEYAAIKPLREGTGQFRVRLVDGALPPSQTGTRTNEEHA